MKIRIIIKDPRRISDLQKTLKKKLGALHIYVKTDTVIELTEILENLKSLHNYSDLIVYSGEQYLKVMKNKSNRVFVETNVIETVIDDSTLRPIEMRVIIEPNDIESLLDLFRRL